MPFAAVIRHARAGHNVHAVHAGVYGQQDVLWQ